MATTKDYALDMASVRNHVVTTLAGAAKPLPVTTLAATHNAFTPDLARVKRNEAVANDDGLAKVFLVRKALATLVAEGNVAVDGEDMATLLVPLESFGLDPGLRQWHGGDDPFSPMKSGGFAANIRDKSDKDDMAELRASMQAFGWVPYLPAIADERGVVLMGHRRLAVAKELGIEPVIRVVELGRGDAADAERWRIAIASNLGGRNLSPTSRKRIGEYMFGEGWSYEAIGKALGVSFRTIGRDATSYSDEAKAAHNEAKAGHQGRRAKAANNYGHHGSKGAADKPKQARVKRRKASEFTAEQVANVIALWQGGTPIEEVARQHECSKTVINELIYNWEGAQAAAAAAAAAQAAMRAGGCSHPRRVCPDCGEVLQG